MKTNLNKLDQPLLNEKFLNELERSAIKFIPKIIECRCTKVYDGDTIHVVNSAKYDGKLARFKWKVRLNGIDTPEIKDEKMHKRACAVRDKLAEKILGKIIRLDNIEYDKYGRLLADVYLDNENIVDWLKKEGYGVEYAGGKKPDWNTLDV